VLNYSNGNKTKTAELLGIALTTLYRKISEYGLE
jgi:two-component system, NtrC family, response regulator